MKKVFILLVMMGVLGAAQRSVLVEAFSSTTCPHCPFSNAACERLARNYLDTVSVIEYMSGLSGSDASVRSSFYGVSAVPDVYFVGIENELGSTDDTTGDYNRYRPHVNNWKWVVSQILIDDMEVAVGGGGDATVDCRINITTTLPGTDPDPRVFCVITERGVFGDGRYNQFIMRDIISSATGDTLHATMAGDTERFHWEFNVGSWEQDSLDAVVFIQSYQTKLVFQSIQVRFYTPPAVSENPAGNVSPGLEFRGRSLLLNLSGGCEVKLSVADVTGRKVAEVFAGTLGPGAHEFAIPALGHGIYFAVAETGLGVYEASFTR